MIPLNVLEIQATQAIECVRQLRQHAKEHRAAGSMSAFDAAIEHCMAVETLLGQVRAAFFLAKEKAAAADDDGCPVNDPDCMGRSDECHTACVAPMTPAEVLRQVEARA